MFSTFFRRWVLLVSFRCYLGFIRVCLSNGLMILLGTRTDFFANAFYATINLHFSQLSRWLDFWLVSLNRLKLYKKTRKRKSWQHLLQLGSFTMRKMLQWEFPLLYFLTSLLKLAFVSMEWCFPFFNPGNKFVLMEEKFICQQPCSESYRSNEVLHSLVCASEKVQGAFTGFQEDPCRII